MLSIFKVTICRFFIYLTLSDARRARLGHALSSPQPITLQPSTARGLAGRHGDRATPNAGADSARACARARIRSRSEVAPPARACRHGRSSATNISARRDVSRVCHFRL